MEISHKNIVYTVDGLGFVGYHYDERFIKFRQVAKITYDTLKDNYQFENNVKLPYYY